jgi:hypothetical protein
VISVIVLIENALVTNLINNEAQLIGIGILLGYVTAVYYNNVYR